jgi:hypothetical protein
MNYLDSLFDTLQQIEPKHDSKHKYIRVRVETNRAAIAAKPKQNNAHYYRVLQFLQKALTLHSRVSLLTIEHSCRWQRRRLCPRYTRSRHIRQLQIYSHIHL